MTTIATIEKIDDSVIDINYAKNLINTLGGDTSHIKDDWCYPQLVKYYGDNIELIVKIKQYFKQYPNGVIAYELCFLNIVDQKWAENIVESNNNPYCAYLMARDCGSERKWAEKIIESKRASYYAYLMVADCGSDLEWAEKIVDKTNDKVSAYWLMTDCGSSREWYEKIKESQ